SHSDRKHHGGHGRGPHEQPHRNVPKEAATREQPVLGQGPGEQEGRYDPDIGCQLMSKTCHTHLAAETLGAVLAVRPSVFGKVRCRYWRETPCIDGAVLTVSRRMRPISAHHCVMTA